MYKPTETQPINPAVAEFRAGDVEPFPSGHTTYLAPLPLPTEASPYSPYVSDLNDTYLDFGGGMPQVFSWQVALGGPFSGAVLVLFGGRLLLGFTVRAPVMVGMIFGR